MMREQDFTDAAVELAQWSGWRVYHALPARTAKGHRTATQGDIGFPDLVLVRPPRLVFAELKTDRGALTGDQQVWLAALAAAEAPEAYLWRPTDLEDMTRLLGPAQTKPPRDFAAGRLGQGTFPT